MTADDLLPPMPSEDDVIRAQARDMAESILMDGMLTYVAMLRKHALIPQYVRVTIDEWGAACVEMAATARRHLEETNDSFVSLRDLDAASTHMEQMIQARLRELRDAGGDDEDADS